MLETIANVQMKPKQGSDASGNPKQRELKVGDSWATPQLLLAMMQAEIPSKGN
jgi:hypothetical protein